MMGNRGHGRARRGRVTRWIAGTVAAVACAAGIAVPQAAAAPGDRIVVLGDSYTANSPDLSGGGGCGQSPSSWPRQLAARTGIDLIDVACSGASLSGDYNINDEAQVAQRRGGFTAQTKAVLIQLGFN